MSDVVVSDDPAIIQAITDDRLARWSDGVLADPAASASDRAVAERIGRTCASVRAAATVERDRLVALLTDASVPIASTTVSDQRLTITVRVEPPDAPQAAAELGRAGYRSHSDWARGASRSFWRWADEIVLTQTAAQTTVVRLRWNVSPVRTGLRGALRRLLVPTAADWATVELPTRFWWAYSIVRLVRLLAERLGIWSRDHGDLEPFLATPDELLDPLFDLAEVGADDVVADIGCGDGRIVIAAAQRRSCRAIGIEQSALSADAATAAVAAAGLAGRVRIVHGDAAGADVGTVTVAVLFVPMVVATRLLPGLLHRLGPGARLLLHEQSGLAPSLPAPSSSHAVITDGALTVVHRWDAS